MACTLQLLPDTPVIAVGALGPVSPPVARGQLRCCVQVAQLSCLHYNSCQYLAHELCCLPLATRPPLAALLGRSCHFLDSVIELRTFGQACLDKQVGAMAKRGGVCSAAKRMPHAASSRLAASVLHFLSARQALSLGTPNTPPLCYQHLSFRLSSLQNRATHDHGASPLGL